MDLTNLTAKVKGFQRRTTQKVLQQMGMADKTEDDSPAFQNFLALGSFASQLKTTIQAADAALDKSCAAQCHFAGQIQSYLQSELSGDGDLPPGELGDFFNSNEAARTHGAILQTISAKFNEAVNDVGLSALHGIVSQLEDLVVRPITKDEDFATITKDLIEEKKKATLDYDSYRRMAQSATSPSEHERIEAKARAAKEKHEDLTRRVTDHINHRNQIRCKLLVHGILTAMQQYCNYYAQAVDILRDTASSLKPLLDVYQMNESQLQNTVNLGNQPAPSARSSDPNRTKSPPHNTKVTADTLFSDYENQNPNRGGPQGKPAPPRTGNVSPHQLDSMMRDNLNLKKAAPQQQQRNVPMNQQLNNNNGATRTPPPTHHQVNSPQLHPSSSLSSHNSPLPTHQPPPAQPQPPQPQPFVDLLGGDAGIPSGKPQPPTPAPQEDILINLMDPTTPAPNTGSGGASHNLFDGDLFAAPSTMPTTPAIHPTNVDLLDTTFQTSSSGKTLANEFDFLTPPPKANNNNNRPPPTTQTQSPTQPPNDFFNTFNFGNQQPGGAGIRPTQGPAAGAGAGSGYGAGAGSGSGSGSGSGAGGAGAGKSTKQEERHELNPAVTQKITNWAERGGRKANLRALLSTLHEVIWVDSGWDAMSLGDLITATQVKKAYHRANLIVHPDKVQTGTVEQQLMAQRIFEALRVSYETFKEEK